MKYIRMTIVPNGQLTLPLAYFEIMQGVFYRLLSFDKTLFAKVHDSKVEIADAIKLFCFSEPRGRYSIRDKKRIYYGAFSFEIRSAEDSIVDTVFARLETNRSLYINGCECSVTQFEMGRRFFDGDGLLLNMNTPITVYSTHENGWRQYFEPAEADFIKAVISNLKKKYLLVFDKPFDGEIEFEALHSEKSSKCVTHFGSNRINAWFGEFLLKASPEMLTIAYYCGIGSKNSNGFGFTDIIRSMNKTANNTKSGNV